MKYDLPEFEFKGRPLTEKEMGNFMDLTFAARDAGVEKPCDEDPKLADEFAAKVVNKRIQAYKLPFKVTNLFLVASLATFVDRVGNVIIMLWLAHKHAEKTGKTLLNLTDWIDMFPWGVPTDDELHSWWLKQKVDEDGVTNQNALDYAATWSALEGVSENIDA